MAGNILLKYGLILILCCGYLKNNAQVGSDTIRIEQGLLAGVFSKDHQVQVYKGIPYAAPPVGDLRWKEPRPAAHWKGVRIADKYGNSAPQETGKAGVPYTAAFRPDQPSDEDCLYLNIWVPNHKKGEQLAVLFWIHGGAYITGAGYTRLSDGENIAKKGIIVISVNYRTGVLGFLAHPELTAESGHHASGNYGLMDLVAALKWVQANIAAFGGDPKRVTIAGQSSGAGSVHNLIASPLAKGLFNGGIAQSGSDIVPPRATFTLPYYEKECARIMDKAGFHSLAELRAAPVDQLLKCTKEMQAVHLLRPVVDGWLLPQSFTEAYREGKQNDVPVLTGINADEGSNSSRYGTLTADEFRRNARLVFGSMADRFVSLYPIKDDAETKNVQIAAARDLIKASTYLWGDEYCKKSKAHRYVYFFKHPIPWPEFPQYGAFHAAELPYVFNNLEGLDRPWQDADRKIADITSSYWVNFVKTGNPNGKNLPEWLPVKPGKNQLLGIDISTRMETAVPEEKLRFFREYFQKRAKKAQEDPNDLANMADYKIIVPVRQ